MRLKLTNDEWKAGLFDDESYASSYGEDGDIYLAEQYLIDNDGRPLIEHSIGEDGLPRQRYQSAGDGLLIRWSEIRYVDFTPWV